MRYILPGDHDQAVLTMDGEGMIINAMTSEEVMESLVREKIDVIKGPAGLSPLTNALDAGYQWSNMKRMSKSSLLEYDVGEGREAITRIFQLQELAVKRQGRDKFITSQARAITCLLKAVEATKTAI